MTLPNIQSKIFCELVGMEKLLKPEYYLKIIRYPKDIEVRLCRRARNFLIRLMLIDTSNISTTAEITAEIHRIWQAIPDKCKKDPLK